MKKRISFLLTLMLITTLFMFPAKDVNASDEECIDGSYLLDEDFSEGTSVGKKRGIYLKSGSSTIVKEGTGKIGAGGTTVGQSTVSKIAITVRVEKLVNGSWTAYTSWTATKYNALYVSTSKVLSVPIGYYYRVYSTHTANSDVSGSFTDGIHI